jgi:hypothetical protein
VRPKQLNQTFTKLTALKLRVFVFFVGTFNIPVVDGDPPRRCKKLWGSFRCVGTNFVGEFRKDALDERRRADPGPPPRCKKVIIAFIAASRTR